MDKETIELLILRLENSTETPTNLKELASLYVILDHMQNAENVDNKAN